MNTIETLINSLKEHPEKDHELGELIRQTLNKYFPKIRCERVFISKNNDYNAYIANIIPIEDKPSLDTNNFIKYDLDIDLSSLAEISGIEMCVWIYHELLANVITDETLLRYKKLMIKYYDLNDGNVRESITNNSYPGLGKLAEIGVFGRTAKEYIEDIHMCSGVNFMIASSGLTDHWNSVLAKYININGGDSNIISTNYIDRMDKAQLREFNKLARKYLTSVVRVRNTDYSTLIKYVIAATKSELTKYYCEKEPFSLFRFEEKDAFVKYDDNRLLRDDQYNSVINQTVNNITSTGDLRAEYENYKVMVDNIKTATEKIRLCANIHNLITKISDKIMDYTQSVTSVHYDTSVLSGLKSDTIALLEKVKKLDLDHSLSVIELD